MFVEVDLKRSSVKAGSRHSEDVVVRQSARPSDVRIPISLSPSQPSPKKLACLPEGCYRARITAAKFGALKTGHGYGFRVTLTSTELGVFLCEDTLVTSGPGSRYLGQKLAAVGFSLETDGISEKDLVERSKECFVWCIRKRFGRKTMLNIDPYAYGSSSGYFSLDEPPPEQDLAKVSPNPF